MILDVAKVLAEVEKEVQKAKDSSSMSKEARIISKFALNYGFGLSWKLEEQIRKGVRAKVIGGVLEIYNPQKAEIKH